MQPKFRIGTALSAIALFAAVLAAGPLLNSLADHRPMPAATAMLELAPVEVAAAKLAPLVLVGAWRLESADPRFGGVSGLAVDGDQLVAITDSGAIVSFPKLLGAQLPARIRDLPAGPGDPRFKLNRDSEAIARDPGNRGWWIAFENRNELWLYDWEFEGALERVEVPAGELGFNTGVEGLAGGAGDLVAFPEAGGSALVRRHGQWRGARLDRRTPLSGSARLDDGSIVLVERRLTAAGFSNALALVRSEGATLRTLWHKRLPVGWRDNVEAVAAEPTASGGYRLWLISDDNFHPRMRTLLLIIDVPAAALPKRL